MLDCDSGGIFTKWKFTDPKSHRQSFIESPGVEILSMHRISHRTSGLMTRGCQHLVKWLSRPLGLRGVWFLVTEPFGGAHQPM